MSQLTSIIVAALAGLVLLAWFWRLHRLSPEDRTFLTLRAWLASLIRGRLGGYRHQLNELDDAPTDLSAPKRVLVVGAGLGGIGAAANLAERGFSVTLVDSASYLGGKIGAWTEQGKSGDMLPVEHGFHAFFHHYYNLMDFLGRVGARRTFTTIDDYSILGQKGEVWGFREVETTPVLNLLSLAQHGIYSLGEVARTRAIRELDVFLRYDPDETFAALDQTSFASWAERAELPHALERVFTTFSRAFFADAERLSVAELVKSFHFYYLSHDHGLLYDYPAADYRGAVLDPIRQHLERHGVDIRLDTPVERLELDGERFVLGDESYDYAVLATPAMVARRIVEASPELEDRAPRLSAQLGKMRRNQRYAVLRVWVDRDIREQIPVFVSTDRLEVLDAVAVYHRITDEARLWAREHAGAVLELHCYAVPDALDSDEAVRRALLEELPVFFPELTGMTVVEEALQVRDDFTALHVGMAADRPTPETDLANLFLAGDWVKLPFPAMLMEAAYSAGLVSANAILAREGLRQNAVHSVPLRGLLPHRGATSRPEPGSEKDRLPFADRPRGSTA